MLNNTEIWLPIRGYEGLYEVSNLGRIKNLKRKVNTKGGCRIIKDKILKPSITQGYLHVTLSSGNTKKTKRVAKLVAQTFVDNPNKKPVVNHIDGNKTNNNASNLEWVTISENSKHAYKNHLADRRGEKHHLAKLNEMQVRVIRKLKGDLPKSEIGKIFGVRRETIRAIHNNKNWNHLTEGL